MGGIEGRDQRRGRDGIYNSIAIIELTL